MPRSQLFYALNGRVVALGQVHQKEVSGSVLSWLWCIICPQCECRQIVSCEVDSSDGGVVKFLKSNDPLIEFIGLGKCSSSSSSSKSNGSSSQ